MDIHYGRKRSGIIRELEAKINDWLSSITDEAVQKLARRDVIVTGGSIASMLMGDSVNDYDLYFTEKDTAIAVAKYYVDKFNATKAAKVAAGATPDEVEAIPYVKITPNVPNIKGELEERITIYIKSAGVAGEEQDPYMYFEEHPGQEAEQFAESLIHNVGTDTGEKYRPVFLSQNAITLSNKVQIIIRFFGSPAEIHNNYDFVHAMCYYDFAAKQLVLPAEALEAMLSRTLVYKGSLYPVASIFRMKKFIERGWRITAGQQLKIMWQISEINLADANVFTEQLTGVDQAYMWQLIQALKDVDPEKITSAYVSTIIDRIFD